MPKILVVEDDPVIGKSVCLTLRQAGFEVVLAASACAAEEAMSSARFDLALLDVGLPDGTGFELFERARKKHGDLSAIFLTARTSEESVVRGLALGAADYIRKPFGNRELLARIQRPLADAAERKNREVSFGPVKLIPATLELRADRKKVELRRREFEIFLLLLSRQGEVVSRREILDALATDTELLDRTLDSHISHLRAKIRQVAGERVQISAVYGLGYRLTHA